MSHSKSYEGQRWTPNTCHLTRDRNIKCEGRVEKRCGTVRTGGWNEEVGWRTERRVERNGDPHYRDFSQNQTNRPLKISQSDDTNNRNWSVSSGSSWVRADASRWVCQKSRRMKSSYKRTKVTVFTSSHHLVYSECRLCVSFPVGWRCDLRSRVIVQSRLSGWGGSKLSCPGGKST